MKGVLWHTNLTLFNPRDDRLEDKSDVIVPLSNEMTDWIATIPAVYVEPGILDQVEAASCHDLQERLARAEDSNTCLLEKLAAESHAIIESNRREREVEGRRNLMVAVAIIWARVVVCSLAVLTICCIAGFDAIIAFTGHLPGGVVIEFQKSLSPYMVVFALYKIVVAMRGVFETTPQRESERFKVLGHPFHLGSVEVKVWHIYIVGQGVDALSDCSNDRSLILDEEVALATKIVWVLTTRASIIISSLYVKGKLSFADTQSPIDSRGH